MDLSQYLETMKNLPERFSNLNFWRGVRKLRDKMVDSFEYVGEWGNGIEGEIDSLKGDLDVQKESRKAIIDSLNDKEIYIGKDFETLTPTNAYNNARFSPSIYKKLQGQFVKRFWFNAIATGKITLYLYDGDISSDTRSTDSNKVIYEINVTEIGYQSYEFENYLFIPFDKALFVHGLNVLGYIGRHTSTAQEGWMITTTNSQYEPNLTLCLGFDLVDLDYMSSLGHKNVKVVSYNSPYQTIINLNTKEIIIPKQYIYDDYNVFGEIDGASLSFANNQYYVWVYYNTLDQSYEVRNYFDFTHYKILMLLFPILSKENIRVNGILPYKIISGSIGFIGDSITAGDGGTPYCAEVANKLGMDFYNYGHSGCSFTLGSGNTFKDYVSTYSDNLDVITIWGGVNDLLWFDRWNIFEQEFESFIQTMISKYPNKKFLILTPQKFYITLSRFSGARTSAWDIPSSVDNKTLYDYVEVEKRIASKYQIPVLDMFSEGVPTVNSTQRNLFYNGNGDWLHPNTTGYKYIANRIAKAIENI